MKKAESHTNRSGKAAEIPTAAAEPAAANLPVAAEFTPEQLEELKARAAKADEYWDRLLRTTADLENFKKRAARERIEAAQAAAAALIQKILPVLDHFEMAQTAAQTAEVPPDGIASLQAGVAMIQQQLKNTLAESGLEEIDASGKPFDPTWHEAVSLRETADVPEGHVVQQLRKGYKLRDRLLRPATVIVARKPAIGNAKPDGKSEAVK
jgi:molecular chaperone GrpE